LTVKKNGFARAIASEMINAKMLLRNDVNKHEALISKIVVTSCRLLWELHHNGEFILHNYSVWSSWTSLFSYTNITESVLSFLNMK